VLTKTFPFGQIELSYKLLIRLVVWHRANERMHEPQKECNGESAHRLWTEIEPYRGDSRQKALRMNAAV